MNALTTLRTRSAWIHIFNTHMPHLAEAPALAEVFGRAQQAEKGPSATVPD
jgi:hypothetical protein